MSLAFDVYCREKPDTAQLAELLGADYISEHEGIQVYSWRSTNNQIIGILSGKKPSIFSGEQRPSEMEAMVARAREQGHTIPEGLLAKFQHDGSEEPIDVSRLIV